MMITAMLVVKRRNSFTYLGLTRRAEKHKRVATTRGLAILFVFYVFYQYDYLPWNKFDPCP